MHTRLKSLAGSISALRTTGFFRQQLWAAASFEWVLPLGWELPNALVHRPRVVQHQGKNRLWGSTASGKQPSMQPNLHLLCLIINVSPTTTLALTRGSGWVGWVGETERSAGEGHGSKRGWVRVGVGWGGVGEDKKFWKLFITSILPGTISIYTQHNLNV